jgi:hypothetical protein
MYSFTVTTEGSRIVLMSSRKYRGLKCHIDRNHAILIRIYMTYYGTSWILVQARSPMLFWYLARR